MKHAPRITAAALVVLIALTATALAVLPKAALVITRPLAGALIAQDTTFTSSGVLRPRHTLTAANRYTRLYFQYYHRGAWRPYTSVLARNSNTATYTKYALARKLAYTGSWRVRAYHKCAKHAASYSVFRSFKITGVQKVQPLGAGCWAACH